MQRFGCAAAAHATTLAKFGVRFIKAAATTSVEVAVSVDWKAYIYGGFDAMWALKPPLDMRATATSANLNVKDVLKFRERMWHVIFHRCDLELGGALARSLRSLSARHAAALAANMKTRSEHSVRIRLLLALLFEAAAIRRMPRSRTRVGALLVALLTACWKPKVFNADALAEMFGSDFGRCAAQAGCAFRASAAGRFCIHHGAIAIAWACRTFDLLLRGGLVVLRCSGALLQATRIARRPLGRRVGLRHARVRSPLRHQRGVDHLGVMRRPVTISRHPCWPRPLASGRSTRSILMR